MRAGRRRIGTMAAALAGAALLGGAGGPAAAAEVKVGVIAPFSGPFAMYGRQFRQAIEVYRAQHGEPAGGHRLAFVWRDLEQADPPRAKALAQELVVKEKVHYLAGVVFTPNALAIAPLAQEAAVPFVIFNAATSAITARSDYIVRTSYTLAQVTVPVARYALEEGVRRVVTAVTDYGPGHNAEAAFVEHFTKGGGTVIESLRMPLKATDFGPFVQRIKAAAPEALYVFLPGGPPTYGFVKAFAENGLKEAGIRFFGSAETQETDLEALGEAALGLETGLHYSAAHASPLNEAFVAELARRFPGAVANFASVGAYDGLHLIHRMVEATDGGRDATKALAAVKGLAWESPRGPLRLDPVTRHVVQNVYIRRVERGLDGRLINREIRTYEAQPDWGWPAGK